MDMLPVVIIVKKVTRLFINRPTACWWPQEGKLKGGKMAIKNVFQETQALKAQIENLSVEDLQAEMQSVADGDTLLVDLREIQEVEDVSQTSKWIRRPA